MLTGENTGIAVSQLMSNLRRGANYEGQLDQIGLTAYDFNSIEINEEVKKFKKLLNLALNDANSPNLVNFSSKPID